MSSSATFPPSAERQAVLGIDLGTQSTKAALVAVDGTPLAGHAVPVGFDRPQAGWAEQRPQVLVESALTCIAELVRKHPQIRVLGIGIAAQMGGAIGVDAALTPVTLHEMWLDTRADADRAVLLDSYGPEIIAKNGIIPFVTPRVRRWLRLDPSLDKRVAKVLAPGGYLAGYLTGAVAADAFCDRTQANLFGCFGVASNGWDADLAERCGMPAHFLPRIEDPFAVTGGLTGAMAARCGLAIGTPVIAGMGDGTGGWLAAGGTEPGICIDTSGSSSHFAVTIDRFVSDPGGLLSCMPSAIPGRFYLLGFTTSTGLAHRWLSESLGKSYAELTKLAESSPPGAGGVLAVPHFNGRVTPFEPSIKGAFLGFDDKTTAGDLYRALLEASAFELIDWLARVRSLVPDVALRNVVNVGGGAQNALWNQIKADVTGLTFRSARSDVNAARGAALAAGIGVGVVDRDRHDWFAPEHLGPGAFAPKLEEQAAYAPFLQAYASLSAQLLPIYRALQQLREPSPPGKPAS